MLESVGQRVGPDWDAVASGGFSYSLEIGLEYRVGGWAAVAAARRGFRLQGSRRSRYAFRDRMRPELRVTVARCSSRACRRGELIWMEGIFCPAPLDCRSSPPKRHAPRNDGWRWLRCGRTGWRLGGTLPHPSTLPEGEGDFLHSALLLVLRVWGLGPRSEVLPGWHHPRNRSGRGISGLPSGGRL